MKPMNFPHRKILRAKEAIERENEYAKLTPTRRLELLDRRLGKDQGAQKERARLMKMIETAKAEAKTAAREMDEVPHSEDSPKKKTKSKKS